MGDNTVRIIIEAVDKASGTIKKNDAALGDMAKSITGLAMLIMTCFQWRTSKSLAGTSTAWHTSRGPGPASDVAVLAARHGLHLEGVTGDHMGVIGALSAVGLRRSGHDGRFIWLPGVRELSGTASVGWPLETTGIEAVETVDGRALPREAEVRVDPWPRPVLLNGVAVLLIQEAREQDAGYRWELLPKETVRRY